MAKLPLTTALPDVDDLISGRTKPREFWRDFASILRYQIQRIIRRVNDDLMEVYGSQVLRGELYIDTTESPSGLMVGDATELVRAASLVVSVSGWPSIPAQGQGEVTVTFTGAVLGDEVVVNPKTAPEAGLMWQAWCDTANLVKMRIINITSGPITPATRDWRFSVRKYV